MVARWTMLFTIASSVTAFVSVLCFGALSDKWGRKFIFALPVIGAALHLVAYLSVSGFGIGLWPLPFASAVNGLMGSDPLLVIATYSYFADTTNTDNRTQIFILAEALHFLAHAAGPFIGGSLVRILPSIENVFEISLAIHIIGIVYTLFILPESRVFSRVQLSDSATSDTEQTSDSVGQSETAFEIVTTRFVSTFTGNAHLFSVANTQTFIQLMIAFACVSAAVSGRIGQFFPYASYRFGWDSFVQGQYVLLANVSRSFHALFTYRLLLWIFTSRLQALAQSQALVRFHVRLVISAMACGSFTVIGMSLATQTWMIFAITIPDGFLGVLAPNMRALLSQCVSESMQGRLFSVLQILEQVIALTNGIIFPNIWVATVKTMPNAFMFVCSGLYASALLSMMFVRFEELSKSDRDSEDVEDNTSAATIEEQPTLGVPHNCSDHQ